METPHLIQLVVQQATVLIAELATSAGLRAPLARLADQVFLDLTREIERQGVTRNVVADMFGLTLRSYQKKVQRLQEGSTDPEHTLWQAVLRHVQSRDAVTRQQVLDAFDRDDPRDVIAVLSDLVASGVIYGTGRGRHASYRPTPTQDQEALFRERSQETLRHLVWLEVGDSVEGLSRSALDARFPGHAEALDAVLARLVALGDLAVAHVDDEAYYRTESVRIPQGSEAGWESAVFDHFRAVCGAIATKLRGGGAGAAAEEIGGATLGFELYPGHPYEREVRALLARTRASAGDLWSRVNEFNRTAPRPEKAERVRVVFYVGQNVLDDRHAKEESHADDVE